MYCHNCGEPNPDGSKFCSNCGTSFDFSQEPKEESKRIEYQLPPAQNVNYQKNTSSYNKTESSGFDSVALGLSIFGLFCCLPSSIAGLIMAIIAKVNGNNSTKVTVALILGILGTVIGLIFTIHSYSTGIYNQ
jgi:uncharacterized Zn finger protein (UPF0148 family)